MKKILFALLLVVLGFGAMNGIAQNKKAIITVKQSEYDFGTIKEGDGKVSHTFEILNTGDSPLVLTRVLSSCGCTTPEWSKEPIPAGKRGKLIVTYDPVGRVNPFVKTVSIYSNGKEGPFVVTIKGEVVK